MNDAPPRSAALIVLENAAPLVGVLVFGWAIAPVMIVYWLENVLRGIALVARIATARDLGPSTGGVFGRLFFAGFTLVHYGGFCLGHGLFVYVLFVWRPFFGGPFGDPFDGPFGGRGAMDLPVREIALAAALIAASLTVEFVRDAAGPRATDGEALGRHIAGAYGRIVVLHLAILFGGFLLVLLGSPRPAVVLLVVLKTAAELAVRRRESARGDGRTQ